MYVAYSVVESLPKKKKKRSMRSNPYLIERKVKGRFHKDFEDLKKHPQAFRENYHVDVETFNHLLKMLQPHLKPKRNTRRADRISPEEKLAVVLEYFGSGSLQRHMASIYRISKQHLGTIIDQICAAIAAVLAETLTEFNSENLIKCANIFNCKWQFPNCIGAIDGKHVAIKAPRKAGSLFYNYKGFHSLVLMAVADATYKFTYVNIGAFGSESDAKLFLTSEFGQKVLEDRLQFPPDANLCGVKVPFLFVADDAFPLCKRIMKPYGGRQHLQEDELIFNYRLSRARRCVENAFGILTSRWQCLKRTMLCSPDRAQKIITACCLLHNYLLEKNTSAYCPSTYADYINASGQLINGEWRENMASNSLYGNCLSSFRGRQSDVGKHIRNVLKEYVNSEVGSVQWQKEVAFLK